MESTSSFLSDTLFDDTDEFLSSVLAERRFPENFFLAVKVKANGDLFSHKLSSDVCVCELKSCLVEGRDTRVLENCSGQSVGCPVPVNDTWKPMSLIEDK